MTKARQFTADSRGAAALEFAIIGPVLLTLLIAATDFGLGFYLKMQVQTAAQRGAIYATVRSSPTQLDVTGITRAITSVSASISADPAPYTFSGCPDASAGVVSPCSSGTPGTYVRTTAKATYTPVFRYPGLTTPMTFKSEQVVLLR